MTDQVFIATSETRRACEYVYDRFCKVKYVKIVSGTRKFDHVTPFLKQLQWLPIIKQLTFKNATMVFKCLNGLAPPYLCQKFKTRSEVHNCNTRNRDRLHIPLCRTAAGQRTFTFRGQKLWNSLPDEFQSITNLDVFKVKIKQHFLRVKRYIQGKKVYCYCDCYQRRAGQFLANFFPDPSNSPIPLCES